VVVAALIAA